MTVETISPTELSASEIESGSRTRTRSVRELVWWWAALVGLAGLAITQPVLDVFGRNPEFFVAGRYGTRQIVLFALAVAFVPATLAVTAVTLAWLANATLGMIAYRVALAGFGALFALVVLGTLGVDAVWVAPPVAVLVAGLLVWLDSTRRQARTLLSYMAAGNAVFLFLFLFASPTAELVAGTSASGDEAVEGPALQGPVVVVVLDELPISTLLRPDGTINASRYPNFARLAAGSTWFRNASSLHPMTSVSVPSIVTGTRGDAGDLPTSHDHPRSYLTLFGDRYPINAYESVTDMVPADLAEDNVRGSVRAALRDGTIVYGHQVLPGSLAERLPSIDHSWGGFSGDLGPDEPVEEEGTAADESIVGDDGYGRWHSLDPFDRSAIGQFRIMGQTLSQVGPEPSVNFVHVALPHYPWTLTPWGVRLTHFPNELAEDPTDPSYDHHSVLRYQLHALQVGAADVAVGQMIDHLQSTGAWDDALVVVTSDHGTGLTAPDFGRKLTDRNREEVLRVPLFIKAPGQATGEVRDEPALTIDVFPSIIDLLDQETEWRFDGHSLFDGSRATTQPKVDAEVDPALDIAARHAQDVPVDGGWDGWAATGAGGDLVGSRVDELTVGDPSELSWAADDRALFASLPTDDSRVPYLLLGTVAGGDGEQPGVVVLAINGTVAGSVGDYGQADGGWRFMTVVAPYYVDGANTVEAYEVERTDLGPVLHPVADL